MNMKILSLDTSATSASVCIYDTAVCKVVAEYYINTKLTHSQTLMPMINSVLASTHTELSDIDLYAVNVGPGSFTGIRIGVSTVKGMAMPADSPCVAVSTLESMAYNYLGYSNIIVCACMDARRNQVYNALFSVNGSKIERICDDRAISAEALIAELSAFEKPIILVGDGADLCYRFANDTEHIHLSTPDKKYQTAVSVAMCADVMYNNGNVLDCASLMPTYLRPSQAERERQNKISKD